MSSNQLPEPGISAAPDGLRRWVPRSLTARLIVTTLLLVALVSVVVGLVTTLALRHFLLVRLDDQLIAASQRQARGPYPGPGDFPDAPCGALPSGEHGELGFGQAVGTLMGEFAATCQAAVVVDGGGGLHEVAAADVAVLAELEDSGNAHTVELSSGDYRVLVHDEGSSRTVTGLPTADVSETVNSLVLWESAVALSGVLLAGVVGGALVRRQLAPLRRVATTAADVTRLSLGSGEVEVIARVPAELTDPSTEVGQVGAALNAMLGHVERSLDTRHESEQRVRRFVADASHELRTPLSTIMGYAELTRRTSDDPAAMAHAMARILAESGRMSSLVNDLLLLARLDSGRPLERSNVDVSKLLVEAVNDARVVSADHAWRLTLPAEPLQVEGDRDRLHQVVSNLLTNAIRHTPDGTTVSVSAVSTPVPQVGPPEVGPREVVVTIRDDGPGMPQSLAGQEFERFSRGDTSRTRSSGGAGLGLSIVQAIVAAHHGAVEIHSVPGDTSVVIRLPVALGPTHGSTARPQKPSGSEPANQGAGFSAPT